MPPEYFSSEMYDNLENLVEKWKIIDGVRRKSNILENKVV